MHKMLGAITRAQSLLILVGDPGVLGKDMFWRTFLNYITLHNGSRGKLPGWRATDVVPLPPIGTVKASLNWSFRRRLRGSFKGWLQACEAAKS